MNVFPTIFKLSFVIFFTYIFFFTLGLKVTLFDAYDYMVMAKYNAGFDNWYPFLKLLRPPLLPALLTPFAYLNHYGVSFETIFTLMHIFSLMISAGFIYGSYLLFRKGLRPEFAAIGAFLLMIQPGFVAYSFEAMADIPAGLIMIFSVFVYLKYKKTQSNALLILLCFSIGSGVAMKYPMVLSAFVFIAAHITQSITGGYNWKQIITDRFYWVFGILSGAMYIAISVITLLPLNGWTFESIQRAVKPYLDHIPSVQGTEESMTANVSFLFEQMTAPLFLLMCTGLLIAWRRKNEINIVMFMWFVVFLAVASIIGAHYEYRYLFPLIPACYFFCALSIQELFDYSKNKWSQGKLIHASTPLVFVLIMVLPLLGFIKEIKSLNTGFYQNDFHRRISNATLSGKNFIWFGPMYSTYQEDASFHPDDPYYKIYHVWSNTISFYTSNTPKNFHKSMHYSWVNSIKDGDILVYDPLRIVLQTKFLPPPHTVPPLNIGEVFPKKFTLETETRNKKVFVNDGNLIELNFDNKNSFTIIISKKIPLTQHYFIWLKLDHSSDNTSILNNKALYKFSKNLIWKVESSREYFDSIKELTILNYDFEEFYYNENRMPAITVSNDTKLKTLLP